MFSAKRTTLTSVAALAALSWTTPVFADEQSTAMPASAAVATPSIASRSYAPSPAAASESATTRRSPFGSKPMAAGALATKRGGDRVFNDAQLKGVVADNQASNLTTGMNVISDGAFSGASGLSTVIQNSGNNVLIQNATIVNVQLK
ncbi:MAG: hypothetical protein H7Y61_17405 [Rhizobiales bacterium]|nr:hypothetical protein [Rhizobacter sp.]